MEIYFMEHWYTSKEIRSILKISNQYLYQLKTRNKIEFKQIGDKKYLYKLPNQYQFQERHIAIYARVSTPKQKIDLENQISLLKKYLIAKGEIIKEKYVYSDIASGMNENRNGLNNLIKEVINGNISDIIISNRDRLTRFGYGYFENFFNNFNVKIIEVNAPEEKSFQEELTNDLIAIIHHFSMKFYGKRKSLLNNLKKDIKFSEKYK